MVIELDASARRRSGIDELYCVPTQAMDLSETPDRARQAEVLRAMLSELRATGRFARVMVYSTLRSVGHGAGIWTDYALFGTPAWEAVIDEAGKAAP